MKRCPYCAEEIQDAAIVCKHCGRDLKFGTAVVSEWETWARELLRTGKTIEAIKTVREGTGLDLKGAKDLVDGWRRQDPLAFPPQSVGKGFALGCVVFIAVLIVIAFSSIGVPNTVFARGDERARRRRIDGHILISA